MENFKVAVELIVVLWITSHTPRCPQVQPLNNYAELGRADLLSVWVQWSSLCLSGLWTGNKRFYCVQTDNVENNKASGSDTVRPTATRATHALVLSSRLCLVLLLIMESWLEWGEERLKVSEWGGLLNRGMEEGRVETRQDQGDGRSLGIE